MKIKYVHCVIVSCCFFFRIQAYSHDISLSTCGWDPEPTEERFLEHVVKFSDLCNNPSLLDSNNIVVRIRNKYYSWKVASPIIASIMIYGRPLLQVNFS